MASPPKKEMERALIDMIDRWAVNTPDAVAAEWKGTRLTFAQLRRASVRVCSLLHDAGVGPRSRVPILTKMSLEMLPAVVGVLRLNACYAPVDVDAWSQARVEAALEATGAKTVLATTAVNVPGYNVVSIGSEILDAPAVSQSLEEYPYLISARQELKPTDLVYIIFTSGTTGKPKGVMIPQSCVVNLIVQDYDGILVIRPGKTVLLLFSIAFDGCAGIIFNSMCNGGTIIMASSNDYADKAAKCEAIIITPSILATMDSPAHYPNVREIWMGGEPPSENLIKLWSSPTCKVYNCYGPTECTTAISSIEMRPGTPIFLGGIIPGIEIILLDENLEETDVGEICIRGPCLAAGYLNNEELTRKRFITWKGERHYCTGDLAKRIPKGFAFVGRIDLQVKNRGFLINLETEVAPALLSYPNVRSAAAIMRDSRLVGFVTPASIPPQLLRRELATKYDLFIVPDIVIPLENLPVTSNQKVDTAALKRILIQETEIYEGLTNQSSPLEIVKHGFSRALGTPLSQINDDSSFWELGGNSLSAVRLSSFLRAHGLSISIGNFFVLDKVSSIYEKAVPIQASEQSLNSLVNRDGEEAESETEIPISDIQDLFISETIRTPAKNNLVFSLKIDNSSQRLSNSMLHDAWEILFQRHSIFRTTYDINSTSQAVQLIHPEPNLDWTEIQVSGSEFDLTWETVRKSIWEHIYEPSRIPWNPFNYLKIVEAPAKTIGIFWVIHHSLFDGWSLGIILHELQAILENKELPPAPQFFNAVHFQERLKIQGRSEADKFWERTLKAVDALKPIDLPKPANPPLPETIQDWLSASSLIETKKSVLDNFAHSQRVSSSSLIHAAWSLVLSKYTRSKTICYNNSFSGRTLALPTTESIVGPLNQRIPIITTIDGTVTLASYLRGIHRNLYEAGEFQWTPYGVLEKSLGEEAHELLLSSSITILFDMPVYSSGWQISDEQELIKPLELRIVQNGETINAFLLYDYARFDGDAVHQVLADFKSALMAIVSLPAESLVRSLVEVIAAPKAEG